MPLIFLFAMKAVSFPAPDSLKLSRMQKSKSKTPGVMATALIAVAVLTAGVAAQTSNQKPGTTAAAPAAAYSKAAKKQPSEDQKMHAEQDYVDGARALSSGDPTLAEKYFQRAASLVPDRSDYAQAVIIAHQHRVTALVQAAAQARRKGRKAEAQKLLDEAEQLDPQNEIVQQHMQLKRLPRASDQTLPDRTAATKVLTTLAEIPKSGADKGIIEVQFNGERHSFHETVNARTMLEQVLQNYGVKVVLDDTVNGRMARLDVDDLTAEEIIPVMDRVLGVFVAPLDEHTVLVGKDTKEAHERIDPELYETLYLPGLSADDLKSIGQMVREIYGIQYAAVNPSSQTLSVRATQDTLVALHKTLYDLMDDDNEVLLDVSLYEMDRTKTQQTGAQAPQQISMFNFDSEVAQVVQANQSTINQAISSGLIQQGNYLQYAELLLAAGLLNNTVFGQSFALFGNGLTRTGVTGVSSTLTMALNSSDARMLDDTQILVDNKQAGTFRAGERYPITTSTFSNMASQSSVGGVSLSGLTSQQLALLGLSSASSLSTASTQVIPQIQYEDLGLTLKTTPTVSRDGNMTLHFDMKLEALGGTSINNIPILNNRAFSGDVMVREGQSAVILSNVTRQETGAISGTPGISELPGFSDLASRSNNGNGQTLVMVIVPHMLRHAEHTHAGPMVMLAEHGPPTTVAAPVAPAATPTAPTTPGDISQPRTYFNGTTVPGNNGNGNNNGSQGFGAGFSAFQNH